MDKIKEEEIISKILQMELEITSAVLNGHKPHDLDQYHEKRIQLKVLRSLLEKK
jgi:hypothetical protein